MGGKAAIIVVIGFSIILGFVVRSLSNVSTRAQTNMSTYAASTESHNLAITGANVGLSQLYQHTSWRETYTQDLSGALNGAFTFTVEDGPGGRPVLPSVSGTLDGRLSIFSPAGISIVDDILYQDRSQTSNNVLGLVAEKYVMIADNLPNSTDVLIDASIFVRSGQFGADNYQSSGIRGRAYVNGSIVQATRGAIGTFASNGTLKSGYLKSYRYDERLADPNFRPPFYPGFCKESFPIASWWESVRIPKFY